MKYFLLISEAAYKDIRQARKWYEEHRIGLAYDLDLCLEGGYEDIKTNPTAYQVKYKNVRVKYIERFPYGIHYIIEDRAIFILGIFHTSKSPQAWSRL